ncbi:MAG TPA: hypothetical protein VNL94_07840 [Candidatus Binatia bacterium]|nr:hypothetical protein [Candidatus Binatia bacterium]
MPPAVQEFWNKLNANEKLVMYGVIAVFIAFLVGIVAGGYFGGTGSFGLVGAIAIVVIYWLKYAPNTNISWPAPIPTIVLVIAGIDAIFAVLGLLSWLGIFGFSLFALAIVINAIGCGLMAYGAWKEYQATPKAAPPSTPPSSAPPAPPAA